MNIKHEGSPTVIHPVTLIKKVGHRPLQTQLFQVKENSLPNRQIVLSVASEVPQPLLINVV